MSEPIIRVENLGKKYLIRHQQGGERYRALRDVLASGFKTGFGLWGSNGKRESTEEFWALKDVSFEVQEGEVVGIIGRNGAGKSTLLKILSRITEPSAGRVVLNGRVASLLEVGTGFHPELTGRENIYLNGSILGMKRAEIHRKFDEIVAFAGVEKFLDTPVKRYSSGMYVRLAFAVAAHLEPEILVVDEVLAVGDAEFQKKCLGKMGEVAKSGRTVLFVSHNMGMVRSFCTVGVYLHAGEIRKQGSIEDVANDYYLHANSPHSSGSFRVVQLENCKIVECRMEIDRIPAKSSARILLTIKATESLVINHLCLLVYSLDNVRVSILDVRKKGGNYSLSCGALLRLRVNIEQLCLVEGEYTLGLFIGTGSFCGNLLNLSAFEMLPPTVKDTVALYPARDRGYVELAYHYETEYTL